MSVGENRFLGAGIEKLVASGSGHVHLVGVGGIGMAGVAFLLNQRGFVVSGCDAAWNRQLDWLKSCGVTVCAEHDVSHISGGVDWVVRSAAIRDDAPEIQAAKKRGIPVFWRGEVLPALIGGVGRRARCPYGERGAGSVAVAGTHGKTTTSMLVAQLLRLTGRRPAWCIGGELAGAGEMRVAGDGGGGGIVVEADESDGTLALYSPEIAVVTNVEFDHMEHFESEADFVGCFRRFVSQTRRRVWYCADDRLATEICGGLDYACGYGFSDGAFLRGTTCVSPVRGAVSGERGAGSSGGAATESADVTDFGAAGGGIHGGRMLEVVRDGEVLGSLKLVLGGDHNALNLLAAVGVCLDFGVDFSELSEVVTELRLPQRRYEQVAEVRGARVISDYAHHPTEVAALVQMARENLVDGGRLLAVFQPHRYTRTLALGADFPPAFVGVDELVLTPVYAASEDPLAGGMVADLYARFRTAGSKNVLLAESNAAAWRYMRRQLREGDVFLIVGAGDVVQIADWARAVAGDGSEGGRQNDFGAAEGVN